MKKMGKKMFLVSLLFLGACSKPEEVVEKEEVKAELNHKELLEKAKNNINNMKSVTIRYTDETGQNNDIEAMLQKLNTDSPEIYAEIENYSEGYVSSVWCKADKTYLEINPIATNKVWYAVQDGCSIKVLDVFDLIKENKIKRYKKQEDGIAFFLSMPEDEEKKDLAFFVDSSGNIKQIQYKEKVEKKCLENCEYKTYDLFMYNYNKTAFSSLDYEEFIEKVEKQ